MTTSAPPPRQPPPPRADRAPLPQARRQLSFALATLALPAALMAVEERYADPLSPLTLLAGALIASWLLLSERGAGARGARARLVLLSAAACVVGWRVFRELRYEEPLSAPLAFLLLSLLIVGTRLSILAEQEREGAPTLSDAGHLTLTAWLWGLWRDLSAPSRALLVTPLSALLVSWALEAWSNDPAALDARLALPYLWTLGLISAALLWGVSRARRPKPRRREAPERLSTATLEDLFSDPPAPRPPVRAPSLTPAPLPPAPTPSEPPR